MPDQGARNVGRRNKMQCTRTKRPTQEVQAQSLAQRAEYLNHCKMMQRRDRNLARANRLQDPKMIKALQGTVLWTNQTLGTQSKNQCEHGKGNP